MEQPVCRIVVLVVGHSARSQEPIDVWAGDKIEILLLPVAESKAGRDARQVGAAPDEAVPDEAAHSS